DRVKAVFKSVDNEALGKAEHLAAVEKNTPAQRVEARMKQRYEELYARRIQEGYSPEVARKEMAMREATYRKEIMPDAIRAEVARDAAALKYNDVWTHEIKGARTQADLDKARRKAQEARDKTFKDINNQYANVKNPEYISKLDQPARVKLDDHGLLNVLGADRTILKGIRDGDPTARSLVYLLREAKDWAPLRKTLMAQIREGRTLQEFRDMGAVDTRTFRALEKAAEKFGQSQELTVFGSFGTDLVTFANRHMLVTAAREGRLNMRTLMSAYGRGGEAMVLGRIIPDMGKVGGPFSDKGDFDFAVYRGRDNSLPGNEAVVWNKDQQVVQAELIRDILPPNKRRLPADFDYAKYENEVLRGFDTSYRGRARFGYNEATGSYGFLGRVQSVIYGEGGAILRDFPQFFSRGGIDQVPQAAISSRFNVENLERIGWWTAGVPYFWNDLAQRSQSTNQWFASGDLRDYSSLAQLYLRGVGTFVGAAANLITAPFGLLNSAVSHTRVFFSEHNPFAPGGGASVPVPPAPPAGIGLASVPSDPKGRVNTPALIAAISPSLAPAAAVSASAFSSIAPFDGAAARLGFTDLAEAVLVDLPSAVDAIVNGAFDAVGTSGQPSGWTGAGNVSVVNGRAVLAESAGRLYSGLSQTFIIPAGARRLTLTLGIDQLGQDLGLPGDAFEVALLDAQSGLALAGTARDLTHSDALLNLQADRTRRTANSTTVTGPNGTTLNVSIDLTAIDPGTAATLVLNLISFGPPGSSVTVDDVRLVSGPSLTVGLDPSTDGGVLGDNLTNVSPVILVGTTQPLQQVTLDLDGDGFDDGSVVADDGGRFQFRGILLHDGENPIRIQAINSEDSAVFETVIVLDRTAPTFIGAEINGGAAQRSMVSSVALRFSENVFGSLDGGDFVLRNFTSGLDVDASLIRRDAQTGGSVLLTFPNLTGGSLGDGNYILALRHAGITDAAGNSLTGDIQIAFFRYFGDSDGDRDVDYLDAFRLRDVLRNVGSTAASLAIFDRAADGALGADDLSAFQIRQLTFLPALPPGTRFVPAATPSEATRGKLAERRGNPSFAPSSLPASSPVLLRRAESAKLQPPATAPKSSNPAMETRTHNRPAVFTDFALGRPTAFTAPGRIAASVAPSTSTATPIRITSSTVSSMERSEPRRVTTARLAAEVTATQTPASIVSLRPIPAWLHSATSHRSEVLRPPDIEFTPSTAKRTGSPTKSAVAVSVLPTWSWLATPQARRADTMAQPAGVSPLATQVSTPTASRSLRSAKAP
ncbi:MAG: hypothetical protein AB7O66_24910, partial [Limisphaerales bacterium]